MQRCLGSYIKDHRERERKGGWPGGGQGRVRGVRAGPSGAEGEDVKLPERRQQRGVRVCGRRSMAKNFSSVVGQGEAPETHLLKNGRVRSRRG